MDSLCLKPVFPLTGQLDVRASTAVRSSIEKTALPSPSPPSSRFSFRFPLKSFWPGGSGVKEKRYNGLALDNAVVVETGEAKRHVDVEEECDIVENGSMERQNRRNWVLKVLQVNSIWRKIDEEKSESLNDVVDRNCENQECDACGVYDDGVDGDDAKENEMGFDKDSFSRMLRKVSLAEAKLYAKLSYLADLAYSIPKIKTRNKLASTGLRFVTSSIEKRELAMKTEEKGLSVSVENQETIHKAEEKQGDMEDISAAGRINASMAYSIAASAASYLQSHTKTILPFKHTRALTKDESVGGDESDLASLMATTDSVTAVVAAKEEVKQAVADDLKSPRSSPCEWFICDDDQSSTRFFVIQGSESIESWQANLLFEPVQFEGLDTLVHRGIYEAAKGIYEQMLPEIRAHLKSHGKDSALRFTGHSLGGSLSLLINLMLLIRGEVPLSSLLPVITFGAPSIMCGGDRLLLKLGLPKNHVQGIILHRDIVPRAFSCNYPDHVAELLRAVNGNFRNHPCLSNQKLLYPPMGEFLILQPDEKLSPHHHLLPSGSGLYILTDTDASEKQLKSAQLVFLNSPHPLEILSDRSAYGSGGTIQRDHDMISYLRSVRAVIRHEIKRLRKPKRNQRRKLWQPILASPRGVNAGITLGQPVVKLIGLGQERLNFSGILQTGRASLKRFSRLVTSQHMHLLVVLLLPARMVLLGAYNVISL